MSIDQNSCERMHNLVAKARIFVSLISEPFTTQNAVKIPYEIFEELKEKKT